MDVAEKPGWLDGGDQDPDNVFEESPRLPYQERLNSRSCEVLVENVEVPVFSPSSQTLPSEVGSRNASFPFPSSPPVNGVEDQFDGELINLHATLTHTHRYAKRVLQSLTLYPVVVCHVACMHACAHTYRHDMRTRRHTHMHAHTHTHTHTHTHQDTDAHMHAHKGTCTCTCTCRHTHTHTHTHMHMHAHTHGGTHTYTHTGHAHIDDCT